MHKEEKIMLYADSLKKWKEILELLERKDKTIFYVRDYWNECGFCAVAEGSCESCPLSKERYLDTETWLCYNSPTIKNLAFSILSHANDFEFDEAEAECKVFITRMEAIIEKETK